MNRRDAVVALLVLGAAPRAFAQKAGNSKRIGFLSSTSAAATAIWFACFKDGLAKLGWNEGQTIAIERRALQGGPELLPALAGELIRLNPDLIVAVGTPAAQVLHRATRDLPVAFVMVSDPVASGIVKSLARPEANVTGVSNFLPATTGKLLEFTKVVLPGASRIAFVYDPANAGKLLELQELRASAPVRGVSIEPHEVRTPADIERAFAAMTKSPPGALIIPADGVTNSSLRRIVALAAKIRRPAIYQTREFVDAGGFMSYGLNTCQHFRRAASYVDRLLKGAKPGDLPVEQPTTFELVINLKTAKALGLTIPRELLLRADEVIQ
ncbi:MAG: ABC transporter substrate-binding protein [Betaproteobacteria bacterium]|nr:ABC transporter substrate-binding protein [Betaproteobacteria bacterium]